MALVEDLNRSRKTVCSIKGNSMRPLLQPGRDFAVLAPKSRPLKKYDCALFRDTEDRLVLHRIVEVKNDCYSFRGDNNVSVEAGIPEDRIVAVMISVIRNGKEVSMSRPGLRIYAFLRCGTWRLRKLARLLKILITKNNEKE